MHASDRALSGRIQKAPENFLDREGIRTVIAESKSGRRNFIRQAFAAAATGAAVPLAWHKVILCQVKVVTPIF